MKYIKGLVSIVTPCYNTGSILHRLFDSVLSQDYPFIEMYAINDGSSDDTAERIKAYIPKFKGKGYMLECINQSNGGQSSALNNGLKLVQGEFFIWPDSDDYFSSPQSISKFVEVLKTNEDISVARCLPFFVDEDTLSTKRIEQWNDIYALYDHFENCLYGKNFFWGAGNYMIRMKDFDEANTEREIFVEKQAGQNWQILLPALYRKKCITIKDSLYCIVERADSHCRIDMDSYEKQKERLACYDRTVIGTLEHLLINHKDEKEGYIDEILKRAKIRNLQLAIKFNKRSEIVEMLKKMPFSFICNNITLCAKSLFWVLFR